MQEGRSPTCRCPAGMPGAVWLLLLCMLFPAYLLAGGWGTSRSAGTRVDRPRPIGNNHSLAGAVGGLHGHYHVVRDWIWRCNATHRYAHMSMLVDLKEGGLGAAWQASPAYEGQSMGGLGLVQSLWFSLSRDGGKRWTAPAAAVHGVAPAWGPVLHLDEGRERVWLLYSQSRLSNEPGGDVVYRTASVADVTSSGNPRWSAPVVLWRSEDADGYPKVTANRLEVLPGGDWVLPVWQETSADGIGISSVLVGREDASASDGRSWEVLGRFADSRAGWLIEGTVAWLPSTDATGTLFQLFRTKDRRIWRSESGGRGRAWTPAAQVASLKNPNSKVAVAAVTDSRGTSGLVLAYNPAEDVRSPLVLAYSTNGESWTEFAVLEDERAVPGRWYAYPTVVQQGSMLRCSYTVYDHLEEGVVMAVVESSVSMRSCTGGRDVCPEDEAAQQADSQPAAHTRKLRNRFLGLMMATVPVPDLV